MQNRSNFFLFLNHDPTRRPLPFFSTISKVVTSVEEVLSSNKGSVFFNVMVKTT